MTDRPGYFYCSACDDTFADAIKQDHIERHGSEPRSYISDEIEPAQAYAFWAFCIAAGVISALFFSAVL